MLVLLELKNLSKKILFVCVENSGRSQMAEAFFKKYSTGKFLAISAGTHPADKVNPIVVQVMNEVGINLSGKTPTRISDSLINESIQTVNMGCMDKRSCPALFVDDTLDWGIDDPKGKTIDDVRKIRDEIENKVKELVERLEK
ncbi:MAG: arsenate reductase ArsC [Crenarchaeota archaeon]|nr:MAG: arsenate reductase ArsC [Thermoproteota archaeon]RDJ33717.1 MAG: arsenate reductase ArsC [Thermoproteota archaeon]RDJ37297.1 MAG: arsenate reductase ArsC [Thermoproteota archaeon]RDJ39251.1 MAG: arsenate reductase ArsC [Thermoproteota archaeon]